MVASLSPVCRKAPEAQRGPAAQEESASGPVRPGTVALGK